MSNDNLRFWTALAKTDPAQTKSFARAGGFRGTAVKPIYQTQRMTETFGPCGIGWGIGEPQFTIVNGDNKEVLVFCTVAVWHTAPENVIHGVGGDKVVTHIKANEKYGRPERWENDDEAFKKAFTDAVGNAFKQLGMSADIHMGLFDDAKYVADLRREAEDAKRGQQQDHPAPEAAPPAEPVEPYAIRVPATPNGSDWVTWGKQYTDHMRAIRNVNEGYAWIDANADALANCDKEAPKIAARIKEITKQAMDAVDGATPDNGKAAA